MHLKKVVLLLIFVISACESRTDPQEAPGKWTVQEGATSTPDDTAAAPSVSPNPVSDFSDFVRLEAKDAEFTEDTLSQEGLVAILRVVDVPTELRDEIQRRVQASGQIPRNEDYSIWLTISPNLLGDGYWVECPLRRGKYAVWRHRNSTFFCTATTNAVFWGVEPPVQIVNDGHDTVVGLSTDGETFERFATVIGTSEEPPPQYIMMLQVWGN